MNHKILIVPVLALIVLSCKGPQKAVSYSELYSEKPLTVYVAPIDDKAERRVVKYPGDTKYNNEIDLAAKYMFQTAQKPISNQGYYVIGPAASMQIAAEETRTQEKMMIGDLKQYKNTYGIDAILFPTIHKWAQNKDEWIVYAEYVLVSTTSNAELMHVWVKGTKLVPVNFKGEPLTMKFDSEFAADMELSNASAQRCFLVEQMNDYVLRNLPTSSDRRQFEGDRYFKAHPSYFSYFFSEEGTIEIEKISMEQYEQECFVND
ncbi:MAG: hypothetical protein II975_02120 [Bacteroidales bacterium]|nr:hypothetical protein [Bacteroidales bacterium]